MLAAGWFLENAWLIPVIPGIAFFVIILFGRHLPAKGSEVGIASLAAATVLSFGAAVQWIQRTNDAGEGFVAPVIRRWTWWQNDGVHLSIGIQIDGLSVTVLALVAFISLLVQIYSLEYVRGDRRYTHFFAAMTLFSAGMLVMVLAESTVQFILGWEIMGLCSFMLIGHWWEEEPNARAALKAFFTVRVGDVGLLVGVSMLYFGSNSWAEKHLGTTGFSIQAISGWALSGEASHTLLLWTAVALFVACIGKSGQFPLHTWLPDAMAGPTPVSSLLHSSTMVVAGVFLVARLYPVFWRGFEIPVSSINLIVVVAAITIVISGLLAFVQNDIKKVLAYSTVGQLGYMMLGLGAGAWLPAVFHLFTHAFFKCCLFLCAGSVSHSGSHHSFDMKKDMGGLRKKMPITTAAWIVASLALVGMFPFAGFFSKDEIIDNVGDNGYAVFMWVALVGAALTAMYTVRATYLTFFGEPRGAAAGGPVEHEAPLHASLTTAVAAPTPAADPLHTELPVDDIGGEYDVLEPVHAGDHAQEHKGPHESGKLILVPVCILAVLSLASGWANPAMAGEQWHNFAQYVEPRAEQVIGVETAAATAAQEVATEGEATHASGCGYDAPEEGVCYAPATNHAEFHWFPNAATSLLIVLAALAASWAFCVAFYTRKDRRLVGLTERVAPLRWGYTFLVNKYYLDALYEGVIVHAIAHPIARAANWVNQNVIDAVVNGAGTVGKRVGAWAYRNVDQRGVDGAVNLSGVIAEESGEALRPVQSGKVNQYGALLFGAAAVGAIVLVIINV